jgi:hypothetical protein
VLAAHAAQLVHLLAAGIVVVCRHVDVAVCVHVDLLVGGL